VPLNAYRSAARPQANHPRLIWIGRSLFSKFEPSYRHRQLITLSFAKHRIHARDQRNHDSDRLIILFGKLAVLVSHEPDQIAARPRFECLLLLIPEGGDLPSLRLSQRMNLESSDKITWRTPTLRVQPIPPIPNLVPPEARW
jgi:hypothetical protein